MSSKEFIRLPSPAPGITTEDLVLHRHTWFGHIRLGHGNVLLGHVRQAMNDPCEIAESATVPGDYLLLNKNVQSPAGQDVLRVPFRYDPVGGTNVVTSAYYVDGAKTHKVVWSRGDD